MIFNSLQHPLITIGVTAYNAVDSIEQAIQSALLQTWRPIEILIVDDCSTDGTDEVLDHLSQLHPELRIFKNSLNSGVAVSRNRIINEASGEFIVFFDDDDVSLPMRLQEQYSRIVEYESKYSTGDPVICHTARRVKYPHGVERYEPTMGQCVGRKAPSGRAVAQRILLGKPLKDGYGACPTCSQMARVSTYKKIGGFDQELRRGEDTDFNIRLAESGGHFVGIDKPLVIQNMTQTTDKSIQEEYRNFLLLMEKHRDILEREDQYEFCKRWINVKQAWMENRRLDFMIMLSALALGYPILTCQRLIYSFPNLGLNKSFKKFHLK